MPNLKFLALFVPEILRGPEIPKSVSCDPHVTPFDLILHFFVSNHCRPSRRGCDVFITLTLWPTQKFMADDIILLSPSIVGLQSMLGKCFDVAYDLSLQFNVNKCHIIVFGKKYNCQLPTTVFLGSLTIDWCPSVKYLGVYLPSGKYLKFDIMPAKRAFYSACNSIFLSDSVVDELALLALQESYSLPVLMYAIPALSLRSIGMN